MSFQASDAGNPAKADHDNQANEESGNTGKADNDDEANENPGNTGKAKKDNQTNEEANGKQIQTIQYTADRLPNYLISALGEVPEKYTIEYFNKMPKGLYPEDNFFFTVCEQDIGALKTVMVKGVSTIKCDVTFWPPKVEKEKGDTTVDEPKAIMATFWGDQAAPMQQTMRQFIGKVN
jgi:hypothetical protein